MKRLNRVFLIGRLATDVDLKTTGSGITVCQFRLAVRRRFARQQGVHEADFIPVVAWRKTAEICAKLLKKGDRVGISGSMQTRNYDAQDGSKRYVTEVVADEVEFLSNKDASNVQESLAATAPPQASADAAGFSELDDEDLPF